MEAKGHQKAIGGFIVWILTILGLAMYSLWMLLDEDVLHLWGVTYYPDKYWGIAVPATLVMCFLYYWVTYMCMYLQNTKPLTDLFCITDSDARSATKVGIGSLADIQGSVPPIEDIPVSVTSKMFYQPWQANKVS